MAKGISLHIGLNEVDPDHYSGWSGLLNACEADAEDLEALAKAQGFETELLKTSFATREAVLGKIQSASKQLESGDFFLLSYSGHGGQVPDYTGEEPDLKDETWCLYDGQLIDDELYALWAKFASLVRILVLSDSCHSGTAIRLARSGIDATDFTRGLIAREFGGENTRFRYMPADVGLRTYRANRDFYLGIQQQYTESPTLQSTVRLISGCQDNQLSLDGSFNGLFTGMLLRVWNSGKFKGNYDEFHKAVLELMPPTQSPNHYVIGVHNPDFTEENPFTI